MLVNAKMKRCNLRGKEAQKIQGVREKIVFQWFAVPKWGTVPRVALVYNTQGFVPKRAESHTLLESILQNMGELYLRHLSFADVFVNSKPTWIMVMSSCLGRLQLLMAWGYVSSREVQSIALPSFTGGIPDFCNNQFACEHFVSPWSLFIEPPENGFPALVLEPRTKTPPILNFPLTNVLHLSSFVFSALWRSYFWPKPPNQVRHVATSNSSQVALLSVMQYMFFWCCFVLQCLQVNPPAFVFSPENFRRPDLPKGHRQMIFFGKLAGGVLSSCCWWQD